jgi:hypothetical protein
MERSFWGAKMDSLPWERQIRCASFAIIVREIEVLIMPNQEPPELQSAADGPLFASFSAWKIYFLIIFGKRSLETTNWLPEKQ